ncbi:hypothetical protein F5148DRAFT_1209626 [Russula earlei]|uniref:Uncharacterized protein n=1 Tax=Russula earlei TaxID=71964 RepID=A0ACC0U5C8_9AGAM|nr:hypothetical protein F5148DRAFT_1209626 [Russula earlei]
MADREPLQANRFAGRSNLLPPIPRPQESHRSHDAAFLPSPGHDQFASQWEGVPLAVGSAAIQGTLRNLHHTNITHDGIESHLPPPGDPVVPHIYPNVGLAQGVRVHEQANFPENRPGYPDTLAYQAPAFGQSVREYLRWLASRYVHHPDSQVDMFQMEPGFAGRYKVVIILDMADLL